MKKLLFLMTALLISCAILAQGSKEKTSATKSFLAFHAGPSIPVGDFSKKGLDPDLNFGEGGFAKTGFNLNLNYGYQFIENFGVAASAFYNNNKLDNQAFIDALNAINQGEGDGDIDFTGLKMDHWQWYGLTVGPALMGNLTPKLAGDLRVMAGVANANSPKLTYTGFTIMDEDWALTPVFEAGANLRIDVGKNMFIYTGVDYLYMKPKFTTNVLDPDTDEFYKETSKQKMSVLNITGGLGIRF